jgi:hypothetical protein
MHFKTVRSIPVVLALTLYCWPVVLAQSPDADAHATEVLSKARAALGGAAALNAIESLLASGDFRVGSGVSQVPGEVKVEALLPDKLMRTMKWSPTQAMNVTTIEAMNGDQVWTDSKLHQPNQMAGLGSPGGGGMGRGGGRGGGGMGRGGGRGSTGGGTGDGGAKGPAPDLKDGMDDQQIQSYFSCLIMALLLRSPDSTPGKFAYQGEADINGAKADSLKITTKDGLIISLAIDQQTHRPIMAGYSAPMQDTSEQRPSRGHRVNGQTVVQDHQIEGVEIYFSEYKAISVKKLGDIWLPYQITRTSGGLTVEDMHIKTFQLNPRLNAKQFEQKH